VLLSRKDLAEKGLNKARSGVYPRAKGRSKKQPQDDKIKKYLFILY
jgi:hypothetical protein